MKIENIKFRGKSKRTGEWLYGDLVRNVEGAFAIVPPFEMSLHNCCENYEVDKETIGQFTGLYDEDGKAVYEGDILKQGDGLTVVNWYDGGFCDLVCNEIISNLDVEDSQVIGNIHDNQELLNKKINQ